MHDLSLPTPHSQVEDAAWTRILNSLNSHEPLPEPYLTPLDQVFSPLLAPIASTVKVIGQIGQSLDGRIATESGDSYYVNGLRARQHLHRLRAWADAVVVGVGTILSDDPELTVRHVPGSSPARVIIDPRGRIAPECRCLRDDSVKRMIVSAPAAQPADTRLTDQAEVIILPSKSSGILPSSILQALIERGYKRILIEGGANTLSRFLAERVLNRLHVLVAPILIGSGISALDLPPIRSLDQALRPHVRAFMFEDGDILFDCAFDPSHKREKEDVNHG